MQRLANTLGALYQKRFLSVSGVACQHDCAVLCQCFISAAIRIYAMSFAIDWTPKLLLARVWLVFVLYVGAVFLLLWLIKVIEAGRVSTLFLLVLPVVAIEAWWLFDKPMTLTIIIGREIIVS